MKTLTIKTDITPITRIKKIKPKKKKVVSLLHQHFLDSGYDSTEADTIVNILKNYKKGKKAKNG